MELSIANNDPTKTCCGQAADVRVGHKDIRRIDMASELSYKIIKAVGEESSKGKDAFEKLEQIVNEHIREV